MATGNRKRSATGKKSSSGRKTNSGHKRNTKKQQEREAEFTREVILWIVVAVSLLLFISNFGFGGTIGGTVSRFFFGLFGIISYIFPIVLLVGTFFAVSNQGNRVAAVKLVAVILFVAFLCMFFELISDGTDAKSAMDAYRYSFDAKSGGGQILVCVAGRGYYQEEGKEAVEMKPGDCINIPTGVKHWHGAAPDEWFSHLAIEVPGVDCSNEWCEAVSEKEYAGLR